MTKIIIALLTFNRLDYSLLTIAAVREYLARPAVAWYVADGGSTGENHAAVLDALRGEEVIGSHSVWQTAGANWNAALRACHAVSDVVLWLENDWRLTQALDLTPYVELLERQATIGMVRFGGLAVGLRCEVTGYAGMHYLTMHRSAQYAYSGNPALRHRRFVEHYGYYNETTNPGDTEIDYDACFRASPGPEIVWPVECGWGWFGHAGTEKSY